MTNLGSAATQNAAMVSGEYANSEDGDSDIEGDYLGDGVFEIDKFTEQGFTDTGIERVWIT
jgi:hypothetical protein